MRSLSNRISPADHVRGRPDARIELLEYGDYQCPYCGRAHAAVQRIRDLLGDELRFAYRNFPLTHLHPQALAAAQAAEAAARQGRFWEMHDLLYDRQDHLEDRDLLRHAQELGLDLERFATDLDSGSVMRRIESDFAAGNRIGVHGTPTFFVNGERYDGPSEADALLAFIRSTTGEAGEARWS